MTEFNITKTKSLVLEHKLRVLTYLSRFINNLLARAVIHDDSKLTVPELEPYATVIDEFGKHPFGSEGYEQIKSQLQGAITHHYENNRHHPEHFENGINDMDLVDLLEMLADWKAATLNKGGNGDIHKSISMLSEKYGINPQLSQILSNTVKNFGLS